MPNKLQYSLRNRQQRKLCSNLAIEQCLARRVLCICNVILRHPLFDQIPRAETHKLSAIADVIKLQKGESLFFRAAPIENIYFILKGSVKLFISDCNSTKVFIDQIAQEGDGIMLESLFSDLECFTNSAEALESTTVLLLDRKKFRRIILASPVIMQNLLAFISERLLDVTERLQDQVLMDVSERLGKFIVAQNCESNNQRTKLSKTDLAYLLGTIPATLSRAVKQIYD